ncbi:NAD(P)/FAD-dependent oxidoreductase [Cytophagales bacterium LB-30]|uniref:NAD(P)/FAD-dependent oxidoreductase n=1 Tax=Shiella aurantiaca TaxID=3058365 RepID=A0ABT8F7J4_9BACT|nr:NAD(P)/FAD-dependent oxidoreductase [Shiella aurantiaca]MDN4166425.1 NAD(P)/FAD-dependent oxidoreductase [Shiella aurantiaca]
MPKDVIIMGGGLAGLTAAIQLAQWGRSVQLFEKGHYPSHKVCGEYISNEVRPYLERLGVFPEIPLPQLNQFFLSDIQGNSLQLDLPLGGFGISRYTLDHHLYQCAVSCGVEVFIHTSVQALRMENDVFTITTEEGAEHSSRYVVGAFGKRSLLDKFLQRPFMQKRSPYIGVKYHIRLPYPENQIALHNFPMGYCGISRVEGESVNLCYLASREALKPYKDIRKMEEALLFQNPHLKQIFEGAEFLWDKPLVINEVSFEAKEPVEGHVLMCGDSAGLITPLCGNGMAMAIHAAKLASEAIHQHFDDRQQVEQTYAKQWKSLFALRLWAGRNIQKLFGHHAASRITVGAGKAMPFVAKKMITLTHGSPF